MTGAVSAHPLTFDVQYPASLSRWLWLFKMLLILPHLFVILVLGLVFYFRIIVAWFAVVFTGTYPRGFFDGNVAFLRYMANISAYAALMSDVYPAFGTTPKPESPVTFDLAYPPDGKISRIMTLFIILRVLVMIVPIIIMYLRSFVAAIIMYIVWIPILFTGNYPRGMFDFVVETQRLSWKVQANLLFMTDVRP